MNCQSNFVRYYSTPCSEKLSSGFCCFSTYIKTDIPWCITSHDTQLGSNRAARRNINLLKLGDLPIERRLNRVAKTSKHGHLEFHRAFILRLSHEEATCSEAYPGSSRVCCTCCLKSYFHDGSPVVNTMLQATV